MTRFKRALRCLVPTRRRVVHRTQEAVWCVSYWCWLGVPFRFRVRCDPPARIRPPQVPFVIGRRQ